MSDIRVLFLASMLCCLYACGGGSDTDDLSKDTPPLGLDTDTDNLSKDTPPLSLSFTAPPIELAGVAADYVSNIAYGKGELEQFDIFLPNCEGPTPLIIFIHGFGFVAGDKINAYEDPGIIREILQSCIAYATVNYSLLPLFPFASTGTPTLVEHSGVLSSLLSIARSLQFMRHHFASFNLDPENVALYGISAGGGAGLWLGTHDDLADPTSKDPVLQESTRVKAVAAERVQATYNVLRWEGVVSSVIGRLTTTVNGNDVPSIFEALGQAEHLLLLMNIESKEDIYTLENQAYRSNVDMLGLIDAGDAPIFVNNYRDGLTDPFNLILHHGLHAIALKERADEVGLESVIYAEDQEFGYIDPSGESLVSFLVRHIK